MRWCCIVIPTRRATTAALLLAAAVSEVKPTLLLDLDYRGEGRFTRDIYCGQSTVPLD